MKSVSILVKCWHLLSALAIVVVCASDCTPPGLHSAGHVPDALPRSKPLRRLADATPIDVVIGLPLRNTESLNALLHDLYDPESPRFQQYLKPEQYVEMFGPTKASYDALVNFAKANNLHIVTTTSSRKMIHVSAPAAVINKVFHVTLYEYKHPTEDRLYYAPDVAPTIDISIPISHISGLDNFRMPGRVSDSRSGRRGGPNGANQAGGPGGGGGRAHTGADFRAAYAPNVSLTGKGQVVGIVEFDGYSQSDITTYETQTGLPNVPIQNVYVNGYTGGNPNEESAADIELVISMAPGISKAVIYGASHDGPGIHDVLTEMANPMQGEPLPAQITTSYYIFYDKDIYEELAQLAAQGQAFFAASGDWGSYNEVTGKGDFPPADHPLVTSVGGTQLQTNWFGAWTAETVWPGSGGGYSPWQADPQFAIPTWQTGIDFTQSHGSTSMRNAPDVAMVATNIVVYDHGQWEGFAGTSAAAPLWAGFMALVNQQAMLKGRPPVGFANPGLYSLGKSPNYASFFHDITVGNNFNATNPSKYSAVAGYDLCTGWGSPNGRNLIDGLTTPAICQGHPELCYPIYDPWWWLKCPACGLAIFLQMGDDFRHVAVFDSLGRRAGEFQRLDVPVVRNGVRYNYRARLIPQKGMGYVLRAELAPGKTLRDGSFRPRYFVRRVRASRQTQ